jgi:hypothetical protein
MMMAEVLIVNNPSDRYWIELLRQAALNLGGTLMSLDQQHAEDAAWAGFDLIILDASAVDDLTLTVERIREANRSARIIVVSHAPHWKQARETILVGGTSYGRKEDNLPALMGILQDSLSRTPPVRRDWQAERRAG